MDNDIFSAPIHMVVYEAGRCPNCHTYKEDVLYDYGTLPYREFERKLDETVHQARPITCSKCGASFAPQEVVYREMIGNAIFAREAIEYGVQDEERLQQEQEGQARRFDVFREQEEQFWKEYENFALANWPAILHELTAEEWEEAYQSLSLPTQKSVASYRKDATQRFQSPEEKRRFWRAANRYLVYDHLLDLGPLAWVPEKEVKEFGRERMRYLVLHFPIDERLEPVRTELIGQVVRKDRGDNAFLFHRISQLTDELNRTRKKVTEYFHRLEAAKYEIAGLQQRLGEAYDEIRRIREEKHIALRDPSDIRKIHELKGLIHELLGELRELRPKEEQAPVPTIEEKPEETNEPQVIDLSVLNGKTVGIFGGRRQEQAQQQEWPCRILAHTAEKQDPAFYQTLEQSDILVVITTYISHAAMWEAKAYAIGEGKPILFSKKLNLERILEEVAGYLHSQKKTGAH